MFVPPLIFGVLCGIAYGWMRRMLHHRELAAGTITVIFWITLYLFERSWANTLGESLGLFVYLGIPVIVLDRLLYRRKATNPSEVEHQFDFSEPMRRA
jgi:NhaP-type Na+/H+ or K+/H+ antiporter